MLTAIRSSARTAFVAAALFAGAGLVAPSVAGAAAADFPPGAFSDGGRYKLSDLEGKVVVLFFYEQNCPSCRASIPARNKVIDQYKDKPVKFLAIAPGDTLAEASGYTRDTKLKMPAFSDLFGVMQTRYDTQISLQNIYQVRVIDGKGNVVSRDLNLEPAKIDKALETAKWKYRDGGYHANLAQVVDLLEWNQLDAALLRLRPLVKGGNKQAMESAAKLMDVLKAEAKGWAEEAAKVADKEPVQAMDLYAKAAAVFQGDPAAKAYEAELKKLSAAKPVIDELAARKLYDSLYAAMPKAQMKQKPQFAAQAKMIGEKYPETPTGKRAAELAADLERATAQ